MSEVFAVVEGQSEATFIREVLAPWLASRTIYLVASPVGKPGHKGGNVYSSAKRDFMKFLKQRTDTYVTSFFDFYGMTHDWPGRKHADELSHDEKPLAVERAIKADVTSALDPSINPARLIPYVQMHEFEALLFARPAALAEIIGQSSAEARFTEIRARAKTPEHINDDPNTAPSKRIAKIFAEHAVRYRKPLHGAIAAKRISIEIMRQECQHFDQWVQALLMLAS